METGLREKTVIVTGASSNIGRGILLPAARPSTKPTIWVATQSW